jgi:hypothetical protein
MKKYLLIAVFLIFGNIAKSQVLISLLFGDKLNSPNIEFGLEGGWNFSTIQNLEPSKSLGKFNLGFYFDFKLKHSPHWMFNTGVIVKSGMGADGLPVYSTGDANLDNAFKGGSVSRTINYFNVPLLMKYTFKNHMFVKGGIQLGLCYNAYDDFTNSKKEENDLNYTLKVKDNFHPLDAGLAIGAGYRLMKGNGMNFNVQYYYGMVDVVIDDSSPNQYNRGLYLTVGIPIGRGKKPK